MAKNILVRTPTSDRQLIVIPETVEDLSGSAVDIGAQIDTAIVLDHHLDGRSAAIPTVPTFTTADDTPTDFDLSINVLGQYADILRAGVGLLEVSVGCRSDDFVVGAIFKLYAGFIGVDDTSPATINQIGSTNTDVKFRTDAGLSAVLSVAGTDPTKFILTVTGLIGVNLVWTVDLRDGTNIKRLTA